MPCPHNEITIVQRSQRQSAVAAAAYQSGEKLFCEYDQQVKHYPEKRGIVHNEILLPANAPQEYADRNTLWNAAEAVEKQWNSQLARRWVLTIPREIPPDQYAVLVREFCQKQFVSKGMIADFAIHDPHPPGHNPHAHVLLTMRAMDEHGKWLPKSRKVYDLDENGERIKLPSGRWKSHKEDTVDWNDQKYCEIWRHEWEVIQNRYLEANDRPERVDLRSYARQGLDIIPTVHEGAAVRQMEKRGIQTNIGSLNREIKAANNLMKSIRQLIQNLKGWITELGEKRKELLAQKAAEEATLLPNLLMKYMEIRKEERKDWTRAGQNRGTSQDLKAVSEALSYLRQKGLSTVEDLEAFLESSGKSAADYRSQMKPKEARSKVIDRILASRTDCKECKRSRTACTMHSIKHNRLEAAVLFAIQYQVSTAVSYSEIVAHINAAPLKKSQSHRLNDQIAAKEKELTKITRYKQSLYQDWKDGEITQQEYREMKADYERQAAGLSDLLARLTAERKELSNGVDQQHPALVAFAKYQNIEKLTREILIELVDHIKVYENGNISVHFKFADEFRRIAEYIEINTTDTAEAG